MNLEDRIRVDTPEGVSVELTLAGVGSRFLAALVDGLLLGVLLVGTMVAVALFGLVGADPLLLLGVLSALTTALVVGYYVAFETLWGGQTPGKRAAGIRVLEDSGAPIDVWASVVRNLARIVDFLPVAYAAGLVTMLVTAHNQRLGDLAARTIVVRVPKPDEVRPIALPVPSGAPWDVSGVGAAEVGLIRRYLERREALAPERRAQLAERIAGPIRPKVGVVGETHSADEFLERVLAEKVHRSG